MCLLNGDCLLYFRGPVLWFLLMLCYNWTRVNTSSNLCRLYKIIIKHVWSQHLHSEWFFRSLSPSLVSPFLLTTSSWRLWASSLIRRVCRAGKIINKFPRVCQGQLGLCRSVSFKEQAWRWLQGVSSFKTRNLGSTTWMSRCQNTSGVNDTVHWKRNGLHGIHIRFRGRAKTRFGGNALLLVTARGNRAGLRPGFFRCTFSTCSSASLRETGLGSGPLSSTGSS